jgi:transposase
MVSVGLDMHTKHISICALSETGQVAHRARVRSVEAMLRTLSGLDDRFEVGYEASCG